MDEFNRKTSYKQTPIIYFYKVIYIQNLAIFTLFSAFHYPFKKDPLSINNAKPPPRNKDKEYSLQVFIAGLQPKGHISQPDSPGMDKNINKSPR